MDEDRLSPELGRLIDEAKAVARMAGGDAEKAEGVALLVDGGIVHSGATVYSGGPARGAGPALTDLPGTDSGKPPLSAAELALSRARTAGGAEILAAAVAAPNDPGETVLPSAESYQCLVGIDPELPLVLKQQGRWVVLPVSQVHPLA